MENRWEFCPHCGDGWPTYLGETETHHTFSCTHDECEAFFQVKKGAGVSDLRAGMALDPDVVYFFECDGCHRDKTVKVKRGRLMCKSCFKKFNLCRCICTCDVE